MSKLVSDAAQAYVKPFKVPPHPGPDWTRFVCISDNHSRTHYDLPPGDVLLHAGDLSGWGYPEQLRKVFHWLAGLDYPMKIVIAGNHELGLDQQISAAVFADVEEEALVDVRNHIRGESMKEANVYYLEHESLEFTTASGRRWHVYGSPAAPRYGAGSFQYEGPAQAKEIYDRIPPETEILLTHTPAFNCLDLTRRGSHAGCQVLGATLENLEACRLHVCGHIHECAGVEFRQTKSGSIRVSVNAAIARTETAIVVDLRN